MWRAQETAPSKTFDAKIDCVFLENSFFTPIVDCLKANRIELSLWPNLPGFQGHLRQSRALWVCAWVQRLRQGQRSGRGHSFTGSPQNLILSSPQGSGKIFRQSFIFKPSYYQSKGSTVRLLRMQTLCKLLIVIGYKNLVNKIPNSIQTWEIWSTSLHRRLGQF